MRPALFVILPALLLFGFAACGDDGGSQQVSSPAGPSVSSSSPTPTPTVLVRTPTPTASSADVGAVRAAGLNLVAADPGTVHAATASIAVKTAPNVVCRLTVTTASRVLVPLPDSGRLTTGSDGVARWSFVPPDAGRGGWEVVCGDLNLNGPITFP